jgi:hypothetical protein
MIEVEEILKREVWDKLGVPKPKYEYRIEDLMEGHYGRFRHYGRLDAYYGLVFFEYKRPDRLARAEERENAVKQVKRYIEILRKNERVRALVAEIEKRGLEPLVVGVIIDGKHVA